MEGVRFYWRWFKRGGWAVLLGLFYFWLGQDAGPESMCDMYLNDVCNLYSGLSYSELIHYAGLLEKGLGQAKDFSFYAVVLFGIATICFGVCRKVDKDEAR